MQKKIYLVFSLLILLLFMCLRLTFYNCKKRNIYFLKYVSTAQKQQDCSGFQLSENEIEFINNSLPSGLIVRGFTLRMGNDTIVRLNLFSFYKKATMKYVIKDKIIFQVPTDEAGYYFVSTIMNGQCVNTNTKDLSGINYQFCFIENDEHKYFLTVNNYGHNNCDYQSDFAIEMCTFADKLMK
jgi:hypothetical protein